MCMWGQNRSYRELVHWSNETRIFKFTSDIEKKIVNRLFFVSSEVWTKAKHSIEANNLKEEKHHSRVRIRLLITIMECPHLRDSVKVNRDFIKNKKCELSTSSGNRASTELNSSSGGVLWRCLGKCNKQIKWKEKIK